MTCCSARCRARRVAKKGKVVWMYGGKPYCNHCFSARIEAEGVNEKVVRLYDDESLYEENFRRETSANRHKLKTGDSNGRAVFNTSSTHSVSA